MSTLGAFLYCEIFMANSFLAYVYPEEIKTYMWMLTYFFANLFAEHEKRSKAYKHGLFVCLFAAHSFGLRFS